ncbi:Complement C1q-like protein 3 [Mactra antiquata]
MFSLQLITAMFIVLSADGQLCTDDVIKNLIARLDAQQKEIDALRQTVKNQDDEILRLSLEKRERESINITTNKRFSTLNKHVANLIETKDRKKRQVPYEGTVAFSAVLTHSLSNLGVDQNIVFDHVITNIGNGYNENHGVFLAPVTGIYVFHISIYTHAHNLAFCRIAVNGKNMADVYVQGGSVSNAGSQMIIARLNKGDDVAVQNKHQNDYIHSDSNMYTTYSGFLLQDLTDSSGEIVG